MPRAGGIRRRYCPGRAAFSAGSLSTSPRTYAAYPAAPRGGTLVVRPAAVSGAKVFAATPR